LRVKFTAHRASYARCDSRCLLLPLLATTLLRDPLLVSGGSIDLDPAPPPSCGSLPSSGSAKPLAISVDNPHLTQHRSRIGKTRLLFPRRRATVDKRDKSGRVGRSMGRWVPWRNEGKEESLRRPARAANGSERPFLPIPMDKSASRDASFRGQSYYARTRDDTYSPRIPEQYGSVGRIQTSIGCPVRDRGSSEGQSPSRRVQRASSQRT